MRPIKFRAWIPEDPDDESENPKMAMTYDLAFEEFEPINDLLSNVDNLMQFTGLTDKNGKEIYEGDIVRYSEVILSTNDKQKQIQGGDAVQIDGIGSVYWDEVGADFSIELENTVRGFGSRGSQEIEVIGNIHEHPELLKESK